MTNIRPFIHASEFATINPDLWIVPNLIPRDGVVVLASAPKAGKTCFATALALAVASGTPFLGCEVKPGPVLWCSHEETVYERLNLHKSISSEVPFYVAYPDALPMLDASPQIEDHEIYGPVEQDPYVFAQASEAKARLIVIDCLHAACERTNLADNQAARRVMTRLKKYSWLYHIPVLVLHHVTKSATRSYYPERFADSAQILAASSAHFFLESHPHPEGRHLVLHGQGRQPNPPRRQDILSRDMFRYEPLETQPDLNSIRRGLDKGSDRRESILELLRESEPLDSAEIALACDLATSTVRALLVDLRRQGRVDIAPGKARPPRYKLSDDGEVL